VGEIMKVAAKRVNLISSFHQLDNRMLYLLKHSTALIIIRMSIIDLIYRMSDFMKSK
jgi:hypothetical protein